MQQSQYTRSGNQQTPQQGGVGRQARSSNSFMDTLQKRWKMIAGMAVVLVLVVGTGVGLYLSQQEQDVRQQASSTVVGCNWCAGKDQCGGRGTSFAGCDTPGNHCCDPVYGGGGDNSGGDNGGGDNNNNQNICSGPLSANACKNKRFGHLVPGVCQCQQTTANNCACVSLTNDSGDDGEDDDGSDNGGEGGGDNGGPGTRGCSSLGIVECTQTRGCSYTGSACVSTDDLDRKCPSSAVCAAGSTRCAGADNDQYQICNAVSPNCPASKNGVWSNQGKVIGQCGVTAGDDGDTGGGNDGNRSSLSSCTQTCGDPDGCVCPTSCTSSRVGNGGQCGAAINDDKPLASACSANSQCQSGYCHPTTRKCGRNPVNMNCPDISTRVSCGENDSCVWDANNNKCETEATASRTCWGFNYTTRSCTEKTGQACDNINSTENLFWSRATCESELNLNPTWTGGSCWVDLEDDGSCRQYLEINCQTYSNNGQEVYSDKSSCEGSFTRPCCLDGDLINVSPNYCRDQGSIPGLTCSEFNTAGQQCAASLGSPDAYSRAKTECDARTFTRWDDASCDCVQIRPQGEDFEDDCTSSDYAPGHFFCDNGIIKSCVNNSWESRGSCGGSGGNVDDCAPFSPYQCSNGKEPGDVCGQGGTCVRDERYQDETVVDHYGANQGYQYTCKCQGGGAGGGDITPPPPEVGDEPRESQRPGETPLPESTPPAGAMCMSIQINRAGDKGPNDAIAVGDSISLTCGQVGGAQSYDFRYAVWGSGQGWMGQNIRPAGSARQSESFIVNSQGQHIVQCRPCFGPNQTSCLEWENPGSLTNQ